MVKKKDILIVYGSLNSVPSTEGAAPAKVIYETVLTSKENYFKVLSNSNINLNDSDYDKNVFLHVKPTFLDQFILLILKIRYPYIKRREKFITGNNRQLLYYISVCRFLFFNPYDKIIIHVGIGLVKMIKMFYPKKEIIFYHHGTSLHSKLSERQWNSLINNVKSIIGVNKIALIKANMHFANKLNPSRYFKINNAIIPNVFKNTASINTKYTIDCNKFNFAFSGRICIEKGVLNLLKAFSIVYKKNTNVSLYILGGAGTKEKDNIITPYLKECMEYTSLSNLPVVFTGFLNKSDLMNCLSHIDVSICPTDKKLSEEGMPLTIIESFSNSIPVIATDSGGIREMLINEVNGYLIEDYPYIDDLANKMIQISTDTKMCKTMSVNAYKSYVTNYQYDIYNKKLTSVLETCDFIN
jgi:glycosyltransferase involved in cell wall biosynthesis